MQAGAAPHPPAAGPGSRRGGAPPLARTAPAPEGPPPAAPTSTGEEPPAATHPEGRASWSAPVAQCSTLESQRARTCATVIKACVMAGPQRAPLSASDGAGFACSNLHARQLVCIPNMGAGPRLLLLHACQPASQFMELTRRQGPCTLSDPTRPAPITHHAIRSRQTRVTPTDTKDQHARLAHLSTSQEKLKAEHKAKNKVCKAQGNPCSLMRIPASCQSG